MTEKEYISATNRVKVSMALSIMRDVLSGDDYGITDWQHTEIVSRLSEAEDRLFKSYSCDSVDGDKDTWIQRSKLNGITQYWNGEEWVDDDWNAIAYTILEAKKRLFAFCDKDENYQWLFSIVKKREQ